MFKVIVAGCRNFNDYDFLEKKLDNILQRVSGEICIVSGKADGADALGERYALRKGYCIEGYPAEWALHGKAAGPIRNEKMAQNADALVAFWDGKSRGTKNMIETAKKYGLKIRIININEA